MHFLAKIKNLYRVHYSSFLLGALVLNQHLWPVNIILYRLGISLLQALIFAEIRVQRMFNVPSVKVMLFIGVFINYEIFTISTLVASRCQGIILSHKLSFIM